MKQRRRRPAQLDLFPKVKTDRGTVIVTSTALDALGRVLAFTHEEVDIDEWMAQQQAAQEARDEEAAALAADAPWL